MVSLLKQTFQTIPLKNSAMSLRSLSYSTVINGIRT